jgi:hypothetical protein
MIVIYFFIGIFVIGLLYGLWITQMSGKRIRLSYDNWIERFDKKYSIKVGQPIQTTLAGVKHNNCEIVLTRNIRKGKLKVGDPLMLVPDPKNLYDKTATRVCTKDGWMLGWLPNQEWNERIFTDLMSNKKWEASVKEFLKPSAEFNNHNLLIELWEFLDENEYSKT